MVEMSDELREKIKEAITARLSEKRDPVVEAVRGELLQRSRAGIAKYGIGLDRPDLSLRDWLQHHFEELLDAALYAKRAIMALDEQSAKKHEPPPS